jgi:zinc transport system substrate-binding protein
MKKSFLLGGLVVFAILVVCLALLPVNKPSQVAGPDSTHKLKVVASFYTLGEFAHQVGGGLVNVEVITPAGTEPHDYEPTPKQIESIYAADVFLFNGAGLDSWAEKISADLTTQHKLVIEMNSVINRKMLDSRPDPLLNDPHFWLDPELAVDELEVILKTLTTADPRNVETYARNFAAYVIQLQSLADVFRSGLTTCSQRTIVASHDALGYLASAYNFEVIALTGLSPDAEPSAGRLAEIAKLAQDKQIKYIYFETLVSPKLAQTIANEIGAQTLVFNPLEGLTYEELAAGEDYISVMRTNLQNLRTGMICE